MADVLYGLYVAVAGEEQKELDGAYFGKQVCRLCSRGNWERGSQSRDQQLLPLRDDP